MATTERRPYSRQSLANVIAESAVQQAEKDYSLASAKFHSPYRRFWRIPYDENFRLASDYIRSHYSYLVLRLLTLELTLKTSPQSVNTDQVDLDQKRHIPRVSVKPIDINDGTYTDIEKNGHKLAIDRLLRVLSLPDTPLMRYPKSTAEVSFDLFSEDRSTFFLLPTRIPQVNLKSIYSLTNNQPNLSLIISPENNL